MKDKFKSHYETIGSNIKRIRVEKGWSQDDLAARCSVNREKISRIENAKKDYMYSTLLEVCEGLEVELPELLSKKD